ncbi:hypothetical protein T07_5341 [Trichinella nelsoni]|uniref:Uncharacterized protein n=1 Tax=Trichinella nelsoni TaxID=6336 RepID=A0A0V0S4X4_9BILA|nr:hypothetical protein T07_5341 [Trichinella nelsoni]
MKIFLRVTGEKNWENAKLDRKIVNKRSRRKIIDHRHTVNKQLLSVPSCKGLIKRRADVERGYIKLLSFLDVASDSQTSNRSLQTASISPPFLLTRASKATDAAVIRRPSRQLTIEGERARAKPSGESKWRSQAENQSPKDTSCMDGPERGKDYAKNNTTGMSGGTAGRLDSGETKHRLTA